LPRLWRPGKTDDRGKMAAVGRLEEPGHEDTVVAEVGKAHQRQVNRRTFQFSIHDQQITFLGGWFFHDSIIP
jgi:hypothetical protein